MTTSPNTALHIALCVPDYYPRAWLDILRAAMPRAQITQWCSGDAPVAAADYALVWQPTQAFIDAHSHVKALFNLGAGVDGVLKLRLPAHMPLIRLEDCGMAAQMADYVSYAVLRHVRGFDRYEQPNVPDQTPLWQPRFARDPAAYPVGVMGLGLLGTAVVARLQSLGLAVSGWSASPKTIVGARCYSGAAELPDFLAATRVLTNLLPLTPATQGILCAANLRQLQSPAYVINVARGGHLVESELIPLIDSGVLAGACLDVFIEEPLPDTHPFWVHPKIMITPHISAQTLPKPSFAQIADKIARLEAGLAVSGVVDRARGY